MELPVWFQAGVNVIEVEPDYDEGHVHIRFGARLGYSWQVEASDKLGPDANWKPAGNPIAGDDVFILAIHEGDPDTNRFYRVKGTVFIPQPANQGAGLRGRKLHICLGGTPARLYLVGDSVRPCA